MFSERQNFAIRSSECLKLKLAICFPNFKVSRKFTHSFRILASIKLDILISCFVVLLLVLLVLVVNMNCRPLCYLPVFTCIHMLDRNVEFHPFELPHTCGCFLLHRKRCPSVHHPTTLLPEDGFFFNIYLKALEVLKVLYTLVWDNWSSSWPFFISWKERTPWKNGGRKKAKKWKSVLKNGLQSYI